MREEPFAFYPYENSLYLERAYHLSIIASVFKLPYDINKLTKSFLMNKGD